MPVRHPLPPRAAASPRRQRLQGRSPARLRPTRGVVLIDVLAAVLIFSMGVLTIVSLQGMSVRQSSQAKYRADAMLLANDLVSQMWVSDRQVATLSTDFVPGGDAYDAWLDNVNAALPGAEDFPPEVTVEQVAGGGGVGAVPSTRVTVVLRWKPPSSAAEDAANNLTLVSQIK